MNTVYAASSAYVVKGGPWDGKIWESHTPRRFTVYERNGAIIVSHHYELADFPGKVPFWRYVGKAS